MEVHPQSVSLDQPCSDAHLSLVSEWVPDWRDMSPFLGLTREDELGYASQGSSAPPTQTGMAMLNVWKEIHGARATYNRLAEAFRQCGRRDLAERVSELQAQPVSNRTHKGKLYMSTCMFTREQEFFTHTSLSLFFDSGFDVNNVLFELHKAKFPAEKWKSLANGLRLASTVAIIEADHKDAVGKLQALISRWVRNATQPNQWITLVEAIVMCNEPTVARHLATAVGLDYALHSGIVHATVQSINFFI